MENMNFLTDILHWTFSLSLYGSFLSIFTVLVFTVSLQCKILACSSTGSTGFLYLLPFFYQKGVPGGLFHYEAK